MVRRNPRLWLMPWSVVVALRCAGLRVDYILEQKHEAWLSLPGHDLTGRVWWANHGRYGPSIFLDAGGPDLAALRIDALRLTPERAQWAVLEVMRRRALAVVTKRLRRLNPNPTEVTP